MKSLSGGGAGRVVGGRVQGLDLLRSLSSVAGLFGQQTLASLGRRVAEDSTVFERLDGAYSIAGGQLSLEELHLETVDFALTGKSAVDLVSTALGGDLELRFNSKLSQMMLREGSRVAEVFWDRSGERIVFPLALSGSLGAISAKVDWQSATSDYVTRRARDRILDISE